MSLKYRADIDGLRAVAVLVVLFFHSGSGLFSGGYVGVDIFFVISGYLITSIITSELADGNFSFIRFYERRARRILPALTTVIIACLVAGSVLLDPKNLVGLGKSTAATALFSSNILFYFESGYFDGPAELKPLLHTWSLAVEEQYYIFFPLLLILISKRENNKQYLKWLTLIGAFSFLICLAATIIDPSGAFYLIPARAWELFAGSILALNVIPIPQKRHFREAISIAGLALIAFSVFKYTSQTTFPGLAATLPTFGAALVIYSGTGGPSLVSNILSLRPVVFIGLISYSLYLWHWPVIVYAKVYAITAPDQTMITVLIAVIFLLSILSWRYIETPFRKKSPWNLKPVILKRAVGVSMAICAMGVGLVLTNGLPERFNDEFCYNPGAADPEWEHWLECGKKADNASDDQTLCSVGRKNDDISFLVWGDSHARTLASGINLSAREAGLKGLIATKRACPPLLSIERSERASCEEFNRQILQTIAKTSQIETVILAARWALSTKGTRYKQEDGKSVQLVDLKSPHIADRSNSDLFYIGLKRTIARLNDLGKRVVLVDCIPEIGFDVPASNFVAVISGRNLKSFIAPTMMEYKQRTKEVESAFRKIKTVLPVKELSPETYLCNETYCRVTLNGVPLYRDDNHLSTFGSKYLSQMFDPVFERYSN